MPGDRVSDMLLQNGILQKHVLTFAGTIHLWMRLICRGLISIHSLRI